MAADAQVPLDPREALLDVGNVRSRLVSGLEGAAEDHPKRPRPRTGKRRDSPRRLLPECFREADAVAILAHTIFLIAPTSVLTV